MFSIRFYRNKRGIQPVVEHLRKLKQKNDKDSRINLSKMQDYIKLLSELGTAAGEPYLKHLDGDIWELRPLRNRVLFAAWHDGGFILLHHFIKKTPKTPRREIEKAKRELDEAMNGE